MFSTRKISSASKRLVERFLPSFLSLTFKSLPFFYTDLNRSNPQTIESLKNPAKNLIANETAEVFFFSDLKFLSNNSVFLDLSRFVYVLCRYRCSIDEVLFAKTANLIFPLISSNLLLMDWEFLCVFWKPKVLLLCVWAAGNRKRMVVFVCFWLVSRGNWILSKVRYWVGKFEGKEEFHLVLHRSQKGHSGMDAYNSSSWKYQSIAKEKKMGEILESRVFPWRAVPLFFLSFFSLLDNECFYFILFYWIVSFHVLREVDGMTDDLAREGEDGYWFRMWIFGLIKVLDAWILVM